MRLGGGLVAFCVLLAPAYADMLPGAVRKPGAGLTSESTAASFGDSWMTKARRLLPRNSRKKATSLRVERAFAKAATGGYIDERGQLAIPYRFYRAGVFVEGLAPVQLGRRGWGIIDPSGKFVVQPRFGAIAEFSGGLARFEDWERIECNEFEGTKTYAKADASESEFFLDDGSNNDLIACRGGKFGYLDHNGKIAIPAQFEIAFDFSDDRAVIRKLKNGYLAYGVIDGVIDKDGTFVIPPDFLLIKSFSEGLAPACLINEGFIDRSGKFVIPPRFESVQPFSEGLALVWTPNGPPPFYIDHSGKTILKLAWTAWPFSGGLTVMSIDDRFAYVDRSGSIVGTYESFRK